MLIIVSGPEGYWLVCAVQFMYCISAMFDPPEINRIEADVLGCLNCSWSLAKSQQWLTTAITLELRLKTVNNQQDKELVSDCFSQECLSKTALFVSFSESVLNIHSVTGVVLHKKTRKQNKCM